MATGYQFENSNIQLRALTKYVSSISNIDREEIRELTAKQIMEVNYFTQDLPTYTLQLYIIYYENDDSDEYYDKREFLDCLRSRTLSLPFDNDDETYLKMEEEGGAWALDDDEVEYLIRLYGITRYAFFKFENIDRDGEIRSIDKSVAYQMWE